MDSSITNRSTRKRGLIELKINSEEPISRRVRRDVTSSELETTKAELEHERSLRALDAKRWQQLKQRLERQVEFAVEEAREAKDVLDEARQESERHILQLRAARKEALEKLHDCQDQLDECRAEVSVEALEDDPNSTRLKAIVESKMTENEVLKEQLHALREEVQRLMSKNETKVMPKDEDDRLGASSPAKPAVLRELNRVRIQLAETERKNRQLRRAADDWQVKKKQLLQEREMARSATARVQQVEGELKELNKAHYSVLAEIQSWKHFGKSMEKMLGKERLPSSDPNIPPEVATVKRFLDDSKKQAEDAERARDEAQKDLRSAKETIEVLEGIRRESTNKETKWNQERRDLESKLERSNRQVSTLKAKENIWKREAESLRSLVQTCDDLPLSSTTGAKGTSDQSKTSQATLRAHESSLNSAKDEIKLLQEEQERLQKDIEKIDSEKEELQKKHNVVLEKFGKLKDALYAERSKAEKAEERACTAEALAGKGSFDPEKTRVLHLQQNPLMEALKQEVAVMRRQIEAMSGDKPKKAVPGSDLNPDKLHQRLKQSFKEQIGRFREGVYLMTGYKIDMIPGNDDLPTFRVRSLYAEREQDHLMLRWPAGEEVSSLDLMQTDQAKVLATTPSYEYMTKFQSLPAFLASVQLSLFEKQTMMQ